MDCTAITIEAQANTKRVQELGAEEGGKVAQNVVAGVAGLIIPVLWFGMDFQNAAGKEVAALQSRQQYLGALAEQRCAPATPNATQASTWSAQYLHQGHVMARPDEGATWRDTVAVSAGPA